MGAVRGDASEVGRTLLHLHMTCAVAGRGLPEVGVHENQEVPPFTDPVEEVGRLLGRSGRPECKIYLDRLDYPMPLCYISEAPKPSATEQRTCPLQHLNGNILARYRILGKRSEAFLRYADTTRFKGDLYYIQTLATAI